MEKLIRPVFTLDLNFKITPGLVTIGKYDGTHPCLTAATSADKILIHSPHRRGNAAAPGRVVWSESNRELATLNINQKIAALVAGPLAAGDERDALLVGTATHLLAYHVHDNRDVFYRECPDGVRALAVGPFNGLGVVVMVGGNSSVHGLDGEGNEVFWSAFSEVVTAVALVDFDRDGAFELVVSSKDFSLKVLKGEQVVSEQIETEVVTGLAALPENRFAYSVSNGTVGVYEQGNRLWRVKSKHFAISMQSYDLLGLGQPQLVTGWSSGKLDCRCITTGEVLFRDALRAGAAGLVEGDYRSTGRADLVCVAADGEVRGYAAPRAPALAPGVGLEQEAVRALLARQQALRLELRHYAASARYNEGAGAQLGSFEADGVIPANTRLQIGVSANTDKIMQNHVEIFVSTNNSTIIRAVILFAEGIFKGETHVVHPVHAKLTSEINVPLNLPRDHPVDIHIKALVGYPNSVQFHVFEITRQLPRFSMYTLCETIKAQKMASFVEFSMRERLQRVCMWINQSFLLNNDVEHENGDSLKVQFTCLRDDSMLLMDFDAGSGKTVFYTENMTLAADLLQSLCGFLRIEELEREEVNLRKCIERLHDIQDARLRLGTDVADRLGQIRCLVVRAEDSRQNDLDEMSRYYNELKMLNGELIGSYNIRLQNYNEGLETMKTINGIIQKASRLRVGQKTTALINQSRLAIKNNNVEGLLKIIKTGDLA